jgi:uncharacterized protein
MKIIIPEIPKEGLDLTIEEAIEFKTVCSPIKASLRIEKHESEIIVQGDLTAEVRLLCSRCLTEFCRILSVPVHVVYHPVEELKRDEYHEIKAEELDLDFYSGEELELTDLLKEQIELNMPMKPLCSESCKGICPTCGKDLNIDICVCDIKKPDPRFEAFKKLLN